VSTKPLQRRPATEAGIPFLVALREHTMDAHLEANGMDIRSGDPGAARLKRVPPARTSR